MKYTSNDENYLINLQNNPHLTFQGNTEVIDAESVTSKQIGLCSYTSEVEVWNCPSGHTKLADCLEGSLGLSCCNPCRSYNTVTTIGPCSNGPQGGGITPNDPGGNGGGEGGGGEFETNLPVHDGNAKTPCQQIKLQRETSTFTDKIDSLKLKTGLKKETGYIQRYDGIYEYQQNAATGQDANSLILPVTFSDILGFLHTHVDDFDVTDVDGNIYPRLGIKAFSPADVGYLMDIVSNAKNTGKPLNNPYGLMVTSTSNYQIRFTGNEYQVKTFTNPQTKAFKKPYADFMKNFIGNQKKLEIGFLWYMSEKMNLKGLSLFRMNTDGTTTEIKLNADKTDTTETTCPN